MRILIIGGTRFVGHAMADAALTAGHDVTLLHRTPTDELPGATHLLADRNGDLSLLADGRWDATVDVCAYLPGQVGSLHDALGDRGGHHVLVSTVSVYADQASAGAGEDAVLLPELPADTSEVTAGSTVR
jgi:2'-hydroxyisoflavone reductase